MRVVAFVHLVFWIYLFPQFQASKSLNSNEISIDHESRKFRTGRIQKIWDEAIKIDILDVDLIDLYEDLKQIDHQLIKNKHGKLKVEDVDRMQDAELTDNLDNIVIKYGIGSKTKRNQDSKSEYPGRQRRFEDPKWDSLRNIAEEYDFSKNELEMVEHESQQHKQMVDNEILQSSALKLNGIQVPFTVPHVAKLWEKAKMGNFTEKDLHSIKQELHQLQMGIQKHVYFRDQLENSVEKLKYHGGAEKLTSEFQKKHEYLQSKVGDLTTKVRKLHQEISSRLSSGIPVHKEL